MTCKCWKQHLNILKDVKIIYVRNKDICLEMEDWPTPIMGDGCNVNSCATGQLTEYLRLFSPCLMCVIQATDGSVKQMSKSKTKNVHPVSNFGPCMQTILQNFKLSGKSTDILNHALKTLDMKPIHIMTFCPTRMAYTLSASPQIVNMLVLIVIFHVVMR